MFSYKLSSKKFLGAPFFLLSHWDQSPNLHQAGAEQLHAFASWGNRTRQPTVGWVVFFSHRFVTGFFLNSNKSGKNRAFIHVHSVFWTNIHPTRINIIYRKSLLISLIISLRRPFLDKFQTAGPRLERHPPPSRVEWRAAVPLPPSTLGYLLPNASTRTCQCWITLG